MKKNIIITLIALAALIVIHKQASAVEMVDWTALSSDLQNAAFVEEKDRAGCVRCHRDYVMAYERTKHARAFKYELPSGFGIDCETCHGPMSNHLKQAREAEGDVEKMGAPKVISFKKKAGLTSEQRYSVCISCHKGGKRSLWTESVHEKRGLACPDCHYVMEKRSEFALLIMDTAQKPCFQCHKQIRAQIDRQSHHPIKEGKVDCHNCHNPHGTVTEKLLKANSANDLCYQCHAEKRGPFLWEHAPVVESCLNCHTPHGSSHDKLLVEKRPYLCQRCHVVSRHPGTLYALSTDAVNAGATVYNAGGVQLMYRSCSNCHSQIHGSNHPSGVRLSR